jgi:uncharacterized membrane protein required for colicin V production
VLYFIWSGLRTGLVGGFLNLFSTLLAFVTATYNYSWVGDILAKVFGISPNLGAVFGFAGSLIILEIVLNFILNYFYNQFRPLLKKNHFIFTLDSYLGVIPSVVVGLFLVTILMLLVLIIPVRDWLRSPIQNSWWGENVVSKGLNYVPELERFLTKLPYKNLVYLLTPASANDEGSEKLNLPKNIELTVDYVAEKQMFNLVNQERASRGLNKLNWSEDLAAVGRNHCKDMFKRSYFSHYTPEGKSPFDRMIEAGIDYTSAGENLAYAPSTEIAHRGLMNSPGHRENILRDSFGTLGVGVIDGGLNGKMFCQEFTN